MAEAPPPADNPTTALFDLAEMMSDNYRRLRHINLFAYFFIGITLLLLLVVTLALAIEGNVGIALIGVALILSGLVLLRLILFTKRFLEDFNQNFDAIRLVRDLDPIPPVPEGRTALARLERYLKETDPSVRLEMEDGAEIVKDRKLGDGEWPLVVIRRSRPFRPPAHLTLVRRGKRIPAMVDFIGIEKDLESVARAEFPPDRAILLYKAPDDYDGISDDLYTFLTGKEHTVISGGKKHRVRLQIFIEHKGRYEIIPLLP